MTKPSRFPANRNAKYASKNQPLVMAVDLDGFNAMLADMEGDVEKAIRPAAQAGAEVLYKAVLRNVDAIGAVSGTLKASIYQAYSKKTSTAQRANYFVSWRTSDAGLDDNGQPIRTGLATAPHGWLLENGYIQRYAVQLTDDGHWYTVVKPKYRGKTPPWEARGKGGPKPAEAAEWYMPRRGGPVQVAGKAFLRNAASQFPAAEAAVRAKFFELLGVDVGVGA